MNNIQDVHEAHQMWERKFENAGREGIVLNCGKRRSLATILSSIFHKMAAKPATSSGNLSEDFQPV